MPPTSSVTKANPIDFHFDADDAGTPIYNSGGIEGMWWLPAQSSTDYLILSNPSRKTVNGSLVLSSPSANRRIVLGIGPGQTKRIDLRQALGSSNTGAMGGLTLSLPGNESLSATQIVFDEVTGLAAIMKLFDREPDDQPRNHVLRAPMMALSQPDPDLAFPSGTILIPRIFLRNAGAGPAQVSLTIDWRNQSKSGAFVPPRFALSPGEVKVVNLEDPLKSGQIPADANWATVELAYAGRRADLVAVALSYDQDYRYGLQTPFSENISRMWAGGMWHVDSTHNTLITTGNAGSESTTAEVTLFYNGGQAKYRLEKMLSPGQQLWLDVGHLIRDQVPDSDGHTLPPDAMTGSYELRDLDHANVGQLYEGKLVIDKTYGHAAYGCGLCCGYLTPSMVPSPFGGPPGINNDNVIQAQEQCGGNIDDMTYYGYFWASDNTPVATLPTRTLHTVAPGYATGSALIQLLATHPNPRCPQAIHQPTQRANVVRVAISIQSSGTAAIDNAARGAYNTEVGTYSLGAFIGTGQFCTIGYQATGTVTPSNYTGAINFVRTKSGVSYTGATGQTVNNTYPSGTNDTSQAQFEDTDPQSGGSNGAVYDLDAPGVVPAVSQVGRIRYNFVENAQLPDGTSVANSVAFYVRLSCNWGSAGNSFRNEVAGDNVLGLGTTKTSWNLQ